MLDRAGLWYEERQRRVPGEPKVRLGCRGPGYSTDQQDLDEVAFRQAWSLAADGSAVPRVTAMFLVRSMDTMARGS